MKKKSVLIILGTLFGFNILAWIGVFQLSHANLEVNFFDIGQGDSIFLQTPERWQTLIDGGPGSAVLEKLGKEMPFWDRTIDLIILTHPEKDHLTGLLEVLKRYKVKNILWTGIVRDTEEYREWMRVLNEEGARVIIAQAGQKFDICYCEVLYPFENLEGQEIKNSNNTSIVIRLDFGGTSFLFTGDSTQSVEKQLLGLAEKVDSDILKVGHHGSKTSSAPEFIEAVSPQMAIITVGKENSYGHPHQEVLETLSKYGVSILRTDQDGDIKIISDGEHLILKKSKL